MNGFVFFLSLEFIYLENQATTYPCVTRLQRKSNTKIAKNIKIIFQNLIRITNYTISERTTEINQDNFLNTKIRFQIQNAINSKTIESETSRR